MIENTENTMQGDRIKNEGVPVTSSTGGNASVVQTRVDEKLVDILSAYSHGLQKEMSQVKTWMIVLIIFTVLSIIGSVAWNTWRIEKAMSFIESEAVRQTQYMERANKRHWELSKVIEFSQERSKDGKQQETLP